MTRINFNSLMHSIEYGKAYEVKFKKLYMARNFIGSIMQWSTARKMQYLVCWSRNGNTVTIRKFWHNQPGVEVIKQYYDELSMTEINQLVNSHLFKV